MSVFCLQESIEASYVATMKTIRQVKTVFIIFIAFVCCWSPYIVVLLYDNTDSLPLPVHLYASMLAHLHASLNFAIYGLMNHNLYADFAAHLLACCRRVTARNAAAGVIWPQHRYDGWAYWQQWLRVRDALQVERLPSYNCNTLTSATAQTPNAIQPSLSTRIVHEYKREDLVKEYFRMLIAEREDS